MHTHGLSYHQYVQELVCESWFLHMRVDVLFNCHQSPHDNSHMMVCSRDQWVIKHWLDQRINPESIWYILILPNYIHGCLGNVIFQNYDSHLRFPSSLLPPISTATCTMPPTVWWAAWLFTVYTKHIHTHTHTHIYIYMQSRLLSAAHNWSLHMRVDILFTVRCVAWSLYMYILRSCRLLCARTSYVMGVSPAHSWLMNITPFRFSFSIWCLGLFASC